MWGEGVSLKTQSEIDELVRYVRWHDGFKSDNEAINWLNKAVPCWMEQHDTPINYAERMGED